MAVLFVDSGANNAQNATSITLTIVPANDDRSLVGWVVQNSDSKTVDTWDFKAAEDLTQEGGELNEGTLFMRMGHLHGITTGSGTLSATLSAQAFRIVMAAETFSDVGSSDTIVTWTDANTSGAISTSSNDMVVGAIDISADTTLDSPATERENERGGAHRLVCGDDNHASSVTLNWTSSGTNQVGAAWNLNVVAAGGANPKGPLGMPLHGPFAGPVASISNIEAPRKQRLLLQNRKVRIATLNEIKRYAA